MSFVSPPTGNLRVGPHASAHGFAEQKVAEAQAERRREAEHKSWLAV